MVDEQIEMVLFHVSHTEVRVFLDVARRRVQFPLQQFDQRGLAGTVAPHNELQLWRTNSARMLLMSGSAVTFCAKPVGDCNRTTGAIAASAHAIRLNFWEFDVQCISGPSSVPCLISD